MLIRDIQVFIGFANFYQCFIQGFSKIAVSLTSLFKTTESSEKLAPKAFKADNNEIIGVASRANKTVVNLSKNEKSKNWTHILNIGAIGEPNFLTLNAKKAFNYLRLVFIKVLILRHFDLKSHIRIKIDVSGYTIGAVLSQLNLDSYALLNQWHLVAYFSGKIISVKTRYKTHDAELLPIVEAFNTWCHYLEGCKRKFLVITDYKNLCWFINIKSLSSRQVR